MKNALILGAGTAGSMMANKLVEGLPADWQVTVVDRDDEHVYQPGLLFVPFGSYKPAEIVRSRSEFLPSEARFVVDDVELVDADAKVVRLKGGEELPYDVLLVATGTELQPEATEGLTGPGWYETAFDFYTLEGATKLHTALCNFTRGTLLVNVVEMPIKCPVAPLEFAFLADAFFTERGVRDDIEIVFATPLEGAFTKPVAARELGGLLEQKGVRVEPNFHASAVRGQTRVLESYEGSELSYDLLVTVPQHSGSAYVERSNLGDGSGFIPTDPATLQSKAHPEIFALGDATNLPTSKAGSVAHFQGEVLIENVLNFVDGKALEAKFDGHANCFIETGHGKAMLIDFNYDTQPLPGRFPLPGIGPFSLLEESHVNHWGKLGFRWIYWNVLVRGGELPLDHRMATAGKWGA